MDYPNDQLPDTSNDSGVAASSSQITIEYEETRDDANAYMDFVLGLPWYKRQFEHGLRKQRWAIAQWIGACGLFGTWLVGSVLSSSGGAQAHAFGFVVGLMAGFLLYGRNLQRSRYLSRVSAYNRQKVGAQGDAWPRHVRVSVGPEWVVLNWPGFEMHAAWKYFWLVREDQGNVYIVLGSGTGVRVPSGAFVDPDGARVFAARAEAFMADAGETERQRLVKYLAESEMVCPKCKYALRGITTEKCPECGRVLDRLELQELAAQSRQTRSFRLTQ